MNVYFYCLPQGSFDRPAYQYQSIALAEGFRELGIACFSNIDFWFEFNDPSRALIKHDPSVRPEFCDIVILPCQWINYGEALPVFFKQPSEAKKVFIDVCDGWPNRQRKNLWSHFDLVLTYQFEGFDLPAQCKPWAYGLTNHLISQSENRLSWHHRKKEILINHRNLHPVRTRASEKFDQGFKKSFSMNSSKSEKLAFQDPYFLRSGGRHASDYFERLSSTQACSAFGGYFLLHPWWDQNDFLFKKAASFVYGRGNSRTFDFLSKLGLGFPMTKRIYQWDSWRFWESLVFACLTFHLDLEAYGIQLPRMPKTKKEYVGMDFYSSQGIEDLLESSKDFEQIAESGRLFAISHYRPSKAAERLLSYLKKSSAT